MRRYLELWQLTKAFDGPTGPVAVVRDFDLSLRQGEFVCLIGHSGCGKSTVLSIAAGLLAPTRGGVTVAGREIDGPGPDRGVVFQSPCLLPWLTAFENVMLGVDQVFSSKSRTERERIAAHYLELVGLADDRDKKPGELSMGMCQRVGIARAFALSPKVLLLDEPFGMLDPLTRYELQQVLLDLFSRDQKTALMVTHDVDEALFLSDRVAMMTSGPEARVGAVLEVPFRRPRARQEVLEHPDYYQLREQIITFLEQGHGDDDSVASAGDGGRREETKRSLTGGLCMRALALISCVAVFPGAARADDEPSRLDLLEAQVGALQRENRSLQAQVLALSQKATEAAVVAPAPGPAAPQVKVGGQLRLRPEHRDRLKLDATGGTSDVFVGQRARANVTVSTERLRAFVEVQDARNWGTEVSTVSNEGNMDLHQAYLDLPGLGHGGVSLTVGRQELAYGDERLLGSADWLTAARSFDGAVVRYAWKGGMVDALGALVNDRKTAARGVGDMVLSGAYGRFLRRQAGRELDLYILNVADGAQTAGELTGQDDSRITTTGARARYGNATGWQASAEAAYQFGHRGPDDHEANAFALAAGYIVDARGRPGVRFEWDRATGDGAPKDGRSREFNNLFPTNHAVYGYADLQGWRNMSALKGTLVVSPRQGHVVSADFLHFRLLEARGAWKDDAGEVLGQDPAGRSGHEIGDELDLLYRFSPRKDLTALVGYSAFFPGRFAESVGRTRTQSYVYSQVLFKF